MTHTIERSHRRAELEPPAGSRRHAMAKVQSTVTVARPVEAVYRHFLELDKHPTDPDVESVVKRPDGPTGPGTTFRFRHMKGGKARETTIRFISLEPNRSIVFEGDVGPVRPKGTFTFAQTGGATTLSVRIDDLDPVGPFKLLSPVLARVGTRIWHQRLARIKTLLEASDSQPAS
jgi:uncharacterized protein YndB with AHSA1/START domain